MTNTVSKDRFALSEDMAKLAEAYGKRTSGWKEAHLALVSDVRREYQHYINTTLKNLGHKLSEPHNGWDFKRQRETEPIVEKAEREYRGLQKRSQEYRDRRSQFDKKLQSMKTSFPDLNDEVVREVKDKAKTPGDRVLLFGLLAFCVVLEAGVNVSLLASALTTGMLGAFVIALLVSFLNVGIVGAGVGFLFNRLMHQPKAKKQMSRATRSALWGIWLFAVLFLNFFFGRHRENFARITEQHEAAAQAAYEGVADSFASAAESVTDISWNIADWQFESVLFFFLGIGLCIFAFYKTFTFIQSAENDLKNLGTELKTLDAKRDEIKKEFTSLPERYNLETEQLRAAVSEFVQHLDVEYRDAKGACEDLRDDWDKNHIIEPIEAKFVMFRNDNHPDKIDLEILKNYREENNIDTSFPATPADDQHLTDARIFLDSWNDRGKDEFFETIAQARRAIGERYEAYQRPVLGPLDSKQLETSQLVRNENEHSRTENEHNRTENE